MQALRTRSVLRQDARHDRGTTTKSRNRDQVNVAVENQSFSYCF
jgi:hypothetical protein